MNPQAKPEELPSGDPVRRAVEAIELALSDAWDYAGRRALSEARAVLMRELRRRA